MLCDVSCPILDKTFQSPFLSFPTANCEDETKPLNNFVLYTFFFSCFPRQAEGSHRTVVMLHSLHQSFMHLKELVWFGTSTISATHAYLGCRAYERVAKKRTWAFGQNTLEWEFLAVLSAFFFHASLQPDNFTKKTKSWLEKKIKFYKSLPLSKSGDISLILTCYRWNILLPRVGSKL